MNHVKVVTTSLICRRTHTHLPKYLPQKSYVWVRSYGNCLILKAFSSVSVGLCAYCCEWECANWRRCWNMRSWGSSSNNRQTFAVERSSSGLRMPYPMSSSLFFFFSKVSIEAKLWNLEESGNGQLNSVYAAQYNAYDRTQYATLLFPLWLKTIFTCCWRNPCPILSGSFFLSNLYFSLIIFCGYLVIS